MYEIKAQCILFVCSKLISLKSFLFDRYKYKTIVHEWEEHLLYISPMKLILAHNVHYSVCPSLASSLFFFLFVFCFFFADNLFKYLRK